MSWNYRILATEVNQEVTLYMCEVYYDEQGVPDGYADASPIGSETKKEIKWVLRMMEIGSKKGILWGGERFPEPYTTK